MSNALFMLSEYISSHNRNRIPSDIQAMSALSNSNNRPILALAFTTHRDVITDIGYTVLSAPSSICPKDLEACVCAVCDLASNHPVMAAELISPDHVLKTLGFDSSAEDTLFYAATMAVLLLKDALSSYANYKKADLKQWEQNNKGESVYAKYMD